MSELKAISNGEIYNMIEYEGYCETNDLYYLKSEADNVIAEPTAQQLARQRLANTDIAVFAPPPKTKKAEPEPPKFTKPAVMLSAEEKKERQKAYSRAWYERNKDYCRERSKQWAAEHRDKARQFSRNYYHAHKEERNEASKKWRDEHKDIYNARMREYRRKQREKRSDGTRI